MSRLVRINKNQSVVTHL